MGKHVFYQSDKYKLRAVGPSKGGGSPSKKKRSMCQSPGPYSLDSLARIHPTQYLYLRQCLPSRPLSVATQTHIPFTYRGSTDHFLIRAKSFQNYSGPSKAGIRENTVEVTAVPSIPMKPPRTTSLQSVNREGQRGHKGGRVIRASRWILPPNAIPLCTLITSSSQKRFENSLDGT